MKLLILAVLLLSCTSGFSATIQKWTDDSGQIHYGDSPPDVSSQRIEQLSFENSFDPEAYEQALIRQASLEAEVKRIEAREKADHKKAEKILDDYFKDLDRKASNSKRKKAAKRKSRQVERSRSSIKLKRTKNTAKSEEGQPSFRR
ncbi:MAG: DUF4124 domain-containing protein [Gammaproteobacteria bacterium]|nr:DUF4124 domain-containing protein [Gammaproteobacteria bacterium]